MNHCQTCQANYNLGDITSREPVPPRPPVCFTLTWPPVHIAATWSLVLYIFLSVAETGSLACLAGTWLSGRVSVTAVWSHLTPLVFLFSILAGKQIYDYRLRSPFKMQPLSTLYSDAIHQTFVRNCSFRAVRSCKLPREKADHRRYEEF